MSEIILFLEFSDLKDLNNERKKKKERNKNLFKLVKINKYYYFGKTRTFLDYYSTNNLFYMKYTSLFS